MLNIGAGARGVKKKASFNPATLALTGWWKASYSGAPWVKNASAGTSGSTVDLTNSNVDPTVGTAVNSLTPAVFNGSTMQLWANTASSSTLLSSGGTWSIAVLCFPNAAATDSGFPAENPGLVVDTGGTGGVNVMTLGGTPRAYIHQYNGSTHGYSATTTLTLSTWQLIQAKYDGTTAKIRINGGTRATGAYSSGTFLGARVRVGCNYGNTAYFNGSILEIMTMDTTISDANEDNVLSYMRTRYGLALT